MCKVSIITPVYNANRFLNETAECVFSQIFTDWEWILVDDYSTDDSGKILLSLKERDSRVRVFFQNKNLGSGPARNKAIKEAKGEYIAFLDSDDFWKENKLSEHVKFMDQEKAVFSHTSYGFTDEQGNRIRETYQVSDVPVTYQMLLKRTEISCLTAMYNQKKIGKYYMPDIRRKQDYSLWLSILKDGHQSIPLNKELAMYRQVSGSATNNKLKLIFKHYFFLRKTERLSVFNSLYYSFHWGINGLKKYYF